jgi:hypothetical protein
MRRNSSIPFGVACMLSSAMWGCIQGGGGVTNFIQAEGAVLGLEIGANGGAPAGFDLLTIRMVSNAGDTLRDTLDQDGRRLAHRDFWLDEAPAAAFHPRYDVRPMSAWKVELEALAAGQVVLAASAASDRIPHGDTLRLALSLAPLP